MISSGIKLTTCSLTATLSLHIFHPGHFNLEHKHSLSNAWISNIVEYSLDTNILTYQNHLAKAPCSFPTTSWLSLARSVWLLSSVKGRWRDVQRTVVEIKANEKLCYSHHHALHLSSSTSMEQLSPGFCFPAKMNRWSRMKPPIKICFVLFYYSYSDKEYRLK